MTFADLVERVLRLENRVVELEQAVAPPVVAEVQTLEEMHRGFVTRLKLREED